MATDTENAVVQGDSGTPSATQRAGARLFGTNWPGVTSTNGKQWRLWIEDRIKEQEPTKRDMRLHYSRHRHFVQGRQWISTRDGVTWREPSGEKNNVRAVLDQIGPAIDFRLGIITENRPGFKTYPLGTGVHASETAEAQQAVAEHYYNKLRGQKLLRDAKSSAYTDGVAFLHVFVDKHAGPSKEDVELIAPTDSRFAGLKAQGYDVDGDGLLRVPLSETGTHLPIGEETRSFPLGDIATRILLAHEVYADPEAMTVNGPYQRAKWMIIRRVRDLHSARLETGQKALQSDSTVQTTDPVLDAVDIGSASSGGPAGFIRGLPPYPASRHRSRGNQDLVYDYLVFIAPNREAGIEAGAWVRVIGDRFIVGDDELPGGKIPLAAVTDGSTDPQLFPRPVMMSWIPDQLSINALWSTLLAHARIFGTGRVMAQKGTLLEETYTDIVASVIEYTGMKPEFLQGTRASNDTWQELNTAIKNLQDKTGWNDFARGQVTGSGSFSDISGRAVLGAKELFERNFGNDIRAAAEGMSEWACLVVDHARWLFDDSRLIPKVGRGDLAKKISAKDLGEESLVYVDAETLMPLPKALRQQALFDMLQQGMITMDEYRRRAPFAIIRNVHYGDQAQWDRAQWINTYLEENWQQLAEMEFIERFSPGSGMVVWWQDAPDVHKRALLELALDERKPIELRDIAAERWSVYDQLERAKVPGPTGQVMPLGHPAAIVVRQAPLDFNQQPPLPSGQPPVATGEGEGVPTTQASPAPELSGVPNAPAEAPALGEHGSIERQSQQQTRQF